MQIFVIGAIVIASADHVVAARRARRNLNLDHARAHVGEQTHGGRAGAYTRCVDDRETRQGAFTRGARRPGAVGFVSHVLCLRPE